MTELLSPAQLEDRLRAVGRARYHDKHPFHDMMNAGGLTKGQLQAWALNRYCYQAIIPIKDAVILSRMTDPAMRRVWRQRIIDHDGDGEHDGGIARWFVLAEGLGLTAALRGVAGRRLAGDALRRRSVRPFRPRKVAARGYRLVADGNVRAGNHPRPGCRHAQELRLYHPRGAGLFRQAPDPGAAPMRTSRSTT